MELEGLRAVTSRVCRLAQALFASDACEAMLFDGERIWLAGAGRDAPHPNLPIPALTHLQSEVVWISDTALEPSFNRHPEAIARGFRTYVGAAIRLETGERIGVLAVYLKAAAARDEAKAGLLQDLTDLVGLECDRIRATAERNAMIEKLRRSEQRMTIAVASAELYVFELDYQASELITIGDDLALFAEPNTYESTRSEDGYAVILPEDRQQVVETFARHYREGTPTDSEWRINRRDKEVWVHAHYQMLHDQQGALHGVIGSFQNITERKKAELALIEAKAAAEEANLAKSVFLATMSHEIRTPLNGVLGMAQAMAAEELSPIQRDRLGVISQSGESLLAILNDMLDLSKIEAGKLVLEEIAFDLGEIARGAHAAFTALANKKGLSFALDVEPAGGVYLGDPTRLRQVFYNLISNAIKFTEQGEVRVSAAREADNLVMTVADTGIGMTEKALSGLFNKFTQADTSTTRKYGGAGLGLAICKQLAELMGGSITVVSRAGAGSSFTFRAPLKRIGEAQASCAETPEPRAPACLDLRVLAAEDNSVNQLVLKTLLLQIGINPTLVENGQLALEAWEAEDWDVILMDVQMPVMDGPTATREIRAREQATGRTRTPIVALTANAMTHQRAEYQASGMDAHVSKPIDAARLFEALQKVLEEEPASKDADAA